MNQRNFIKKYSTTNINLANFFLQRIKLTKYINVMQNKLLGMFVSYKKVNKSPSLEKIRVGRSNQQRSSNHGSTVQSDRSTLCNEQCENCKKAFQQEMDELKKQIAKLKRTNQFLLVDNERLRSYLQMQKRQAPKASASSKANLMSLLISKSPTVKDSDHKGCLYLTKKVESPSPILNVYKKSMDSCRTPQAKQQNPKEKVDKSSKLQATKEEQSEALKRFLQQKIFLQPGELCEPVEFDPIEKTPISQTFKEQSFVVPTLLRGRSSNKASNH